MCGIAGIWSQSVREDAIQSQLAEAVSRLRHRGPDDNGIWFNRSGLGLGHTRLSILDLSAHGHQPMVSEDGRFVIVFNGEIYNFHEIRQDLAALGHTFVGNGDTEVALHSFREWGPSAVNRFIGMFALALWDEQEHSLMLLRDRAGVKPLYFGWDGDTLIFGSELKALRAFRHWTPEIDRQALGEFLQYGYIAADRTIYKGVHKLKPGHMLRLQRGSDPVITQYWSILDSLVNVTEGTDADIEERLENLLIDAFKHRMVSDVPVGVFLSGGIDSSLVTAILAKHFPEKIRTFTIGFSEDTHDESRYASEVASFCGTDHTQHILDVSEGLEIAKQWGDLFDEPFGDSSGIPTLLVSRLAARDVKVVLSADGGDELFSGYKVYESVLQRSAQLNRIPGPLRKLAALGMSRIRGNAFADKRKLGRMHRIVPGNMLRRYDRLSTMLADSSPGYLMDLYLSFWQPPEIDTLLDGYDYPVRESANDLPGSAQTQISLWDIHHYLPEDILTKVDRTTMAVSLEGREPLLDHRLMEMALNLPPHLRRGTFGSKHILKSILYRYVPRHLVDRPKQGFAVPLERWLRTDLKSLVHDYLGTARIRNAGIMDHQTTSRVVARFYEGDGTLATPLWFLLAFEMWREKWG